MMGSRSIYHEGWKATTNHISTGVLDEEELAVGSRNFDEDRWELFDLSEDFSEATDRADDEPERVRRAERAVGRPRRDATTSFRSPTDWSTASGGFIPPTWPAGLVADVPSRRRAGRRRVGPPPVGRLPT